MERYTSKEGQAIGEHMVRAEVVAGSGGLGATVLADVTDGDQPTCVLCHVFPLATSRNQLFESAGAGTWPRPSEGLSQRSKMTDETRLAFCSQPTNGLSTAMRSVGQA
jgi:hypothetical protein